jgi:hypothetical protein
MKDLRACSEFCDMVSDGSDNAEAIFLIMKKFNITKEAFIKMFREEYSMHPMNIEP